MAKVISQLPSGGSVPKHNNLLGLNEGDYLHLTQSEKAKLDGIQSGAEVNVNADWNAISGDAQILNKPSTFPPSAHTHTVSQITDFAHTHPISDVTGLPTALDYLQLNKEDKSNKNIANGYAGLDSSGKINPIQLPALVITDTFVVASQAEQLALVAEVGDVAVRTDLNKSFILRVTGASTLANWQELLSPTSVDQTIIDGSTNAVSSNAVFDALATKAPISSVHNPVTLGTANGLSLSNQQLSLGLASSGVTGALSGTDWNTFNNKENSFTKNTAFNKNFGITAGTVVEGGTLGSNAYNSTAYLPLSGGTLTGILNIDGVDSPKIFFQQNSSLISLVTNNFGIYGTGSKTDFNTYVYGNNPYGIWTNGVRRVTVGGDGNTTFSGTISASPATTADQVPTWGQVQAESDSQIEISANSNTLDAWNKKTILFTANCTITVPATLLSQYGFVFRTLAGVTVTWAITAPFTWETTPTTTPEKTTGSFMRRGSTNTILLDF